jgi:hypothetical protein
VIAMTAHLAGLLLLGRILPGVAVGGAVVLSFTAMRRVSHHNQFGKALGVWNLLILATCLTGSLWGGLMADNSCRLALGLVPLMALICLLLLSELLPEMPAKLPTLWGNAVRRAWAERTQPAGPNFPVSLDQRGWFVAAIVSGVTFNFVWAVVQRQMSNFWQLVQGCSTGQVALAQLPYSSLRELGLCWQGA